MPLTRGKKRGPEMKDIRKIIKAVKDWVVGSIVFGLMLIIWIEAYIIISQTKVYTIIPRVKDSLGDYDLPALLFGAASLAFFAISFFMVILSFIGWGEIKNHIAEEAKSAFSVESKEFLGGIRLTFGALFFELATKKSKFEIEVIDQEYLENAIIGSESALTQLANSPNLWAAMNNYAFVIALSGDPAYGPIAKKLALELRKMPEAISKPSVRSTYARVVATYSEYFDSPKETIMEAKRMIEADLTSQHVTDLEKNKARRHVAALDRALGRYA
jgi:hypothetical protein